MVGVLLTGSTGFFGSHILPRLLAQGHTVFPTVRTEAQASRLRERYPEPASQGRLHVLIVPTIAHPDAFDAAVSQIEALAPGKLEAVIHTASPTDFRWTDRRTQLVDPAINGTVCMLSALHKFAPSVRRVVLTSSVFAILDQSRLLDPTCTFTEKDWNPDTVDDLDRGLFIAYGVAKSLAEQAAWSFMDRENPSFDLVALLPPKAWGPQAHEISSLDAVNGSNDWVVPLLTGQWKSQIGEQLDQTLWADIRDIADAHIRAISIPALEKPLRRRLFLTGGKADFRQIARIVREKFPEYADRLPGPDVPGGAMAPEDQTFKVNNDETRTVMDIEWITLEKCVVDTVNSVKSHIV